MDFAGKRIWFFIFSFLVIVPGVVFLAIAPGLKAGIDFTGGSSMTLGFSESSNVKQSQIRDILIDQGYPETTVQNLGDSNFFVRTKELDDNEKTNITQTLIAKLDPESKSILRNVPSPFRYGLAAIVALLHDTLIVVGTFAILGELFDIEVNTMFLIAVLTVIGYSVNDTIVVFDKIRENVLIHVNRPFTEIVNLSISETIGRSINTSFTLLITLAALLLFGGATIREFLYVLLIGVVAGTYSSIGIASQVLVSWEQKSLGRLFGNS